MRFFDRLGRGIGEINKITGLNLRSNLTVIYLIDFIAPHSSVGVALPSIEKFIFKIARNKYDKKIIKKAFKYFKVAAEKALLISKLKFKS